MVLVRKCAKITLF